VEDTGTYKRSIIKGPGQKKFQKSSKPMSSNGSRKCPVLGQKDDFFAEKREFRRELIGSEELENKLFRRMQYFYRRELGTILSHFSKKWASPAVDSQKRKGEIHEKKEQISVTL